MTGCPSCPSKPVDGLNVLSLSLSLSLFPHTFMLRRSMPRFQSEVTRSAAVAGRDGWMAGSQCTRWIAGWLAALHTAGYLNGNLGLSPQIVHDIDGQAGMDDDVGGLML
jgi:hypothetical protein